MSPTINRESSKVEINFLCNSYLQLRTMNDFFLLATRFVADAQYCSSNVENEEAAQEGGQFLTN